MTDYGSVEGTLHKDKHGFFLKDILLSRRVWVWSNIVLDGYIGKRISIEGDLEYDKDGNVTSVNHYHIPSKPCLPFVFKPDSELPTAYDVRGILAGSNSVSEECGTKDKLHVRLINELSQQKAEIEALKREIQRLKNNSYSDNINIYGYKLAE